MSFWKSFLAVGTGLSCAMGLMHTPFSTSQQTVIPEQPLGCHLILPPALPVQLITADCAPAPQVKNVLSTAPAESGTIPHHTTSCTVAATTTYPTTFSTPATTQATCATQADLQIAVSSECSSNVAAESPVEDPIPPTAEATCSAPLLTQQTNPDGFAVLQTMETWFKTYMDYRCITDSASIQYQLQQQAWTDEQGLRRIASDYLVAMGTGWLENGCGERFSVTLDTGTTFTVQVGDVKADCHTDPPHCYRPCGSGANVLEFIVDTSALDTAVCNAGTISAYPAFSGNIVALTPLDSE